MSIRILSLWQPWASAIAHGAKRYETRSWATDYRGWIAIHAAKRSADVPYPDEWGKLPSGAVVAIAWLQDIHAIRPEFTADLTLAERYWGDYTTGRFAWELRDVRPLAQPFPYRGSQGLRAYAPPLPGELRRACKEHYPANWPELRRQVLERAGHKCEWCGIPNYTPLPSGQKVVLTTAHIINPDPACDDLNGLQSLCQRCHLRYDRPLHLAVQAHQRRAQRYAKQLLLTGTDQ